MNPLPELSPYLKQFRLSGILDSLEARNRQAIDGKLACTEFLALPIQYEGARREQNKFDPRLRRTTFRATKTLKQFDFERLPKLARHRTVFVRTRAGSDRGALQYRQIPHRSGARSLRGSSGRGCALQHLCKTHRQSQRRTRHRRLRAQVSQSRPHRPSHHRRLRVEALRCRPTKIYTT